MPEESRAWKSRAKKSRAEKVVSDSVGKEIDVVKIDEKLDGTNWV